MKNNSLLKRSLALIVSLMIIISLTACTQTQNSQTPTIQNPNSSDNEVVQPEPDPITVIACSDFQSYGGDSGGAETVKNILSKVKLDFPSANGFICAGDYGWELPPDTKASRTDEGIEALRGAVFEMYPEINHCVFIEGNHDSYEAKGLAKSGGNDPEDNSYGVFVINEDDYMWKTDAWNSQAYSGMTAKEIILQTTDRLETYLDEKADDGFTKPIFVVSHLPLHYSMRTRNDGDGMYANYIFDVLNAAGERGLNIIFLYGHDHSNGWDDYLGGAAVYLAKGKTINIADSSRTVYTEETLAFTYMNAGFIGYYENKNGCDDSLTMTTYKIYSDKVEITRYDSSGVHNLKSMGIHNKYKEETDDIFLVDKSLSTGTKTVKLSNEILPKKSADEEAQPSAEEALEADVPKGTVYARVNINADNLTEGVYLLVRDGKDIMSTNVVTKNGSSGERTGLEIVSGFSGGEYLSTDYSQYEWELKKSGNKWLLCTKDGIVKLTSTQDRAITATLEEAGDEFIIEGKESYTFACGSNVLNYNSRGLINGYANQPASFELYKKVN